MAENVFWKMGIVLLVGLIAALLATKWGREGALEILFWAWVLFSQT